MFIVFEGIDGAGKTTQARLLYEQLERRNIECWLINNPDDGPLGPAIRALSQRRNDPDWSDDVFLMLFVANHLAIEKKIARFQERYQVVIMDRNWLSTMVYQHAAKDCDDLVEKYCDLVPDKLVYLEIEPCLALERLILRGKRPDGLESGGIQCYEKLLELYHERIHEFIPADKVFTFHGQQPAHLLHEEIYKTLGLGATT